MGARADEAKVRQGVLLAAVSGLGPEIASAIADYVPTGAEALYGHCCG